MNIQSYPLHWPAGWPRAKGRKVAQFGTSAVTYHAVGEQSYSSRAKSDLTMDVAMRRLREEIQRLGIDPRDDMIVSTNLTLNLSGLPRGNQGEPSDPGVAVYFQKKGPPMRVIAIDAYTRVRDNLAAVAATLSAMRAIERHGGAQILERAFTGFTALPSPRSCWDILGVPVGAARDEVEQAFRNKAKAAHPDVGGSSDVMAELNSARDAALREIAA